MPGTPQVTIFVTQPTIPIIPQQAGVPRPRFSGHVPSNLFVPPNPPPSKPLGQPQNMPIHKIPPNFKFMNNDLYNDGVRGSNYMAHNTEDGLWNNENYGVLYGMENDPNYGIPNWNHENMHGMGDNGFQEYQGYQGMHDVHGYNGYHNNQGSMGPNNHFS